jgi:hypothetical protein
MQLLELAIMPSGINQLSRFLFYAKVVITFASGALASSTKSRLQRVHFIVGISWFLSSSLLSSEMHLPPKTAAMNIRMRQKIR